MTSLGELVVLGMVSKKQTSDLNVFGIMTLMAMQSESITNNSMSVMNQKMLEESKQKEFLDLISYVQDFLVKHSQLLEEGEVSRIPEARYFLKLLELLKIKDLSLFSLRTLKGYSITMEGKLLPQSYERWMNWGMIVNGWCLTASFSEYPRTEKESLLSEILEDKVEKKFYLTKEQHRKVIERIEKGEKFKMKTSYAIDRSYWKGSTAEIFFDSARRTIVVDKDKVKILHNIYGAFDEVGPRIYDDVFPTIRTPKGGGHLPYVLENERFIRLLTPIECERLQGFPDNWTEGLKDDDRYRLLGNAVTTNVITAIGRNLIKAMKDNQQAEKNYHLGEMTLVQDWL